MKIVCQTTQEWWGYIKKPFLNILQFALLFVILVELDTSLLKHVTFLFRQECCVTSSFIVQIAWKSVFCASVNLR